MFTLYCVVGFSVRKFAQEKEGTEAIPQFDFWIALPGLAWVRTDLVRSNSH